MAQRVLKFRGTQLADELLNVAPPDIQRGGQPIMHSTMAAVTKTTPKFDSPNKHMVYAFDVTAVKTSDVDVAKLVQSIAALMGPSGLVEVFDELGAVAMTVSNAFMTRVHQPPASDPAQGRLASSINVTFVSVEPIR